MNYIEALKALQQIEEYLLTTGEPLEADQEQAIHNKIDAVRYEIECLKF